MNPVTLHVSSNECYFKKSMPLPWGSMKAVFFFLSFFHPLSRPPQKLTVQTESSICVVSFSFSGAETVCEQVAPHTAPVPHCSLVHWVRGFIDCISVSWHFNGRGTLVSELSISMVKLFPLRAYFHWPNRIFPLAPWKLCKKICRLHSLLIPCWYSKPDSLLNYYTFTNNNWGFLF